MGPSLVRRRGGALVAAEGLFQLPESEPKLPHVRPPCTMPRTSDVSHPIFFNRFKQRTMGSFQKASGSKPGIVDLAVTCLLLPTTVLCWTGDCHPVSGASTGLWRRQ